MMMMMIMMMMMGLAAWMEGLCVLAPLHREGKGREGRPASQPANEPESLGLAVFLAACLLCPFKEGSGRDQPATRAAKPTSRPIPPIWLDG